MSKHWIVVADSSKARIFTVDEQNGPLREIDALQHPQGRGQAQDVNSDRPGRSFDSAGQSRHAMGTATDPMEQEAIRFVAEVCDHIRAACTSGRCRRLHLVAGPQMLGLLRKRLDLPPDVSIDEVEKNLGQFDARDIRAHLPQRL